MITYIANQFKPCFILEKYLSLKTLIFYWLLLTEKTQINISSEISDILLQEYHAFNLQ